MLLYCTLLATYRLYLSPIAHFPGPKLAALSLWYEFYHDVVRGGQYCFKISELHDQYGTNPFIFCSFPGSKCTGPIIRINPYELHVRDPHGKAVRGRHPVEGLHHVPLHAMRAPAVFDSSPQTSSRLLPPNSRLQTRDERNSNFPVDDRELAGC